MIKIINEVITESKTTLEITLEEGLHFFKLFNNDTPIYIKVKIEGNSSYSIMLIDGEHTKSLATTTLIDSLPSMVADYKFKKIKGEDIDELEFNEIFFNIKNNFPF